jgi:hypothetical protein
MEMYLVAPKTFLILHSTISHKIIAIFHPKQSLLYLFFGVVLEPQKNEQTLQAFIFIMG